MITFFACNTDNNYTNDRNISNLFKGDKKVIGIQPFHNFDKSLTDTVQTVISKVYGYTTVVLPPVDHPKNAFVKIKSPRYRADSLLRLLRRIKPDTIDYLMGLTSKDISITKKDKNGNIKKPEYKYKDWGVFGLACRPGPSCIISTYRIRTPYSKFMERFKKICVHELGHNLGLPHCTADDSCVMRDAAETIKTIDNVNLGLCESCRKRIQ